MKFVSAVLSFLAVSSLTSAVSAEFVDDHAKIVSTVNSHPASTWQAGINSRFEKATYGDIKRLLGALPENVHEQLPQKTRMVLGAGAIPDTFDARIQWPNCPSVKEVRDQSDCGSCWAFGATEAATDRICIQSGGKDNFHLSAEDLLSCCGFFSGCGSGCDGGYPSGAWSYLARVGIATGGNYGDNSWCVAYTMAPCDHHVNGTYGPCPSSEYSTPSCAASCDSDSTYSTTYASDLHKFASSYSIANDVAQIQHEIMTNGPVEGAFSVYADFPTYKSGVYRHLTGESLGGHAIKILGWGTENGVDYWLVANSWNNEWGLSGFFKILRGSDECGIEDGIVAGMYKH